MPEKNEKNTTANNNGVSKVRHGHLSEISFLNVLFTVMVVCVHILSEPIIGLNKQAPVYLTVYTPWKLFQFVTQGFVFLSGLKIGISNKRRSVLEFYSGRLKRVYFPYLVWVMIYYLYFISIGYFGFDIGDFARYAVIGDISAQFYFVVIIMQLYLLSPILLKLVRKCDLTLILLYSLFISLICGQYLPYIVSIISPGAVLAYNDRLFTTYLFYFAAGIVVGQNYDVFKEKLKRSKTVVISSFVLFSMADLIFSYISYSGRNYIYWCDTLHFAYTVTAIPAFLLFADIIVCKFPNITRPISAVDKSSYMIYLSHVLALVIIRRQLDFAGIYDQALRLVLVCVFMTLYFVLSVFIWNFVKDKVIAEFSARSKRNV